MQSATEIIKERLSIVDVVSSYVALEQSGKNFRAKCPFHNERTPSFFVSPDRGTYYCFGCGAKGDIFTFVETFEGLDFKSALRVLADRAGVTLTNKSSKASQTRERLYDMHEVATQFFHTQIMNTPQAQEYLHARGIGDQSIQQFRIGFVPDQWRLLYDHLRNEGYTDTEIITAGLAKKSKGRIYDRFRGRIMFPLSDSSGRVIAFSGRLLEENKEAPKYLNSPETPLFSKGKTLFGLDQAKTAIRKHDFVILVEGQLDVIALHQVGYANAVGLSGTALTRGDDSSSDFDVVRRLTNNLLIAFDSDDAGKQAAVRSAQLALGQGMEVKLARLPDGADPADVIQEEHGKETWRRCVREAVHIIEFQIDEALERANGDTRVVGKYIARDVLPLVAALDSAIETAHFITTISTKTGIPEEALWKDIAHATPAADTDTKTESTQSSSARKARTPANTNRIDTLERSIAGIAFALDDAADTQLRDVLTSGVEQIEGAPTLDSLCKRYEHTKTEVLFEIELLHTTISEELITQMLLAYEEAITRKRLTDITNQLRIAEKQQDQDRIDELLAAYKRATDTLQSVHETQLQNNE